MIILPERIHFPANESFRLLRWRDHAERLVQLEARGRRVEVAGMGARWHSHPDLEFTIITRGRGTRYVGDHVNAYGVLDCVLLGSQLPHCWIETDRYDGYVLQFHFPPQHAIWRVDGAEELRNLFDAAERGLWYDEAVARAALRRLRRMEASPVLTRSALLLELLAFLNEARAKHARTLSRARVGVQVQAKLRSRLEAVVQWILDHYTQPLHLAEAVRRSAMSRATFCRHFQRYAGKGFVAFVNDVRLAHARHLLQHTSDPVVEIALQCGFGSLSQFNLSFRRKFGDTPTGMRRQR